MAPARAGAKRSHPAFRTVGGTFSGSTTAFWAFICAATIVCAGRHWRRVGGDNTRASARPFAKPAGQFSRGSACALRRRARRRRVTRRQQTGVIYVASGAAVQQGPGAAEQQGPCTAPRQFCVRAGSAARVSLAAPEAKSWRKRGRVPLALPTAPRRHLLFHIRSSGAV